MNFDFNHNELGLFTEINGMMQTFCSDRELEQFDSRKTAEHTREALAMLSKTAYLKLCIEKIADFNGNASSTLMGAREVLASFSPSLYLTLEMSTRLFGSIIAGWGDNQQKEHFLPLLTNGQKIGCVALSENCTNIENDPWQTIGEWEGDQIRLTGRKSFVINSLIADWMAVGGLFEGMPAFFILDKTTPGLSFGDRTTTMGFQGCAISDVHLNDCRISKNQVIHTNRKISVIDQVSKWENQILIGADLGLMKSSYENAKAYSKSHRTGGRPIIAYQEVAFKLAEMLTLYQTSQLFAQRAAWSDDNEPKEAVELTQCAKVFCSESAEKVSGAALQIRGNTGYVSGNITERAYRCAKYTQIAGTSTEIARVKIGDNALGNRA